jgi:small subunit ribosomal protein S11
MTEEEKVEEVVEKKEEKLEEVKRERKDRDAEAILNIYASFNNTIVHVTDMSGKTITKVSGGMVTKYDRLKANPTVAMFIAKKIDEGLRDSDIGSFYVRIRGQTGANAPGPGASAIIKSLTRSGFKILNILDTTRVARGGPKKKGGRRGRRV